MNNKLPMSVGAVMALGMMLPSAAQADPIFHWIQCPACESTGNSTVGDYWHTFTLATAGAYDFWGEATATGIFTFTIYAALSGGVPTTPVGSFIFNSGVDPHGYVGTIQNLLAQQYWVGADGECSAPGQGCNVNIEIVSAGVVPPPPSTVPEPATVVLLGTGLVGILGVGWRRRKLLS